MHYLTPEDYSLANGAGMIRATSDARAVYGKEPSILRCHVNVLVNVPE
jgi:hypothetical protein